MSSPAITTMIQMMESLPERVQDQVLEHLREYLEDLQDELQWEQAFQDTQTQLIAAARHAKQEKAQGQARPLDTNQL